MSVKKQLLALGSWPLSLISVVRRLAPEARREVLECEAPDGAPGGSRFCIALCRRRGGLRGGLRKGKGRQDSAGHTNGEQDKPPSYNSLF